MGAWIIFVRAFRVCLVLFSRICGLFFFNLHRIVFQPPVEKGELAELILSKQKQKKNKKAELLD